MLRIVRRPLAPPSAWLGLLLLALYVLCAGGQPFISDGEVMLITAMRIVDERTVSLPEGAAIYPQTLRRADGYVFSKYGLGQPLAAAPAKARAEWAGAAITTAPCSRRRPHGCDVRGRRPSSPTTCSSGCTRSGSSSARMRWTRNAASIAASLSHRSSTTHRGPASR